MWPHTPVPLTGEGFPGRASVPHHALCLARGSRCLRNSLTCSLASFVLKVQRYALIPRPTSESALLSPAWAPKWTKSQICKILFLYHPKHSWARGERKIHRHQNLVKSGTELPCPPAGSPSSYRLLLFLKGLSGKVSRRVPYPALSESEV